MSSLLLISDLDDTNILSFGISQMFRALINGKTLHSNPISITLMNKMYLKPLHSPFFDVLRGLYVSVIQRAMPAAALDPVKDNQD